MEQKEKVFADGVFFYQPRPEAPDFVIGAISVNPKTFIEFARANREYLNEKGYLKLDVLKSKEKDGCYVELNTYKKPQGQAPTADSEVPIAKAPEAIEYPDEEIDPSSIPF